MSGSILVVTFDTATGIRTGKLVGSTLLEDGAVLSGKIGSGQVASGHLTAALIASIEAGVADEGVTSAKLASGAVIGDRIADVGIFSGKIASGAIGPSTLLANAIIISAKIASGIIGWPHIGSEAILSGHLGSGQIASGHLVSAIAGLVGSVADGGVTSAKIASGIVGDTLLKDFGLLSGKYASGSITEQALVSGISIDVAEITKEPGYRAAAIMSAYDPVYVAAVSGNYVGIAIALSGTMPAIGIAGANIASGSLGDINYGGRAPAPASVVSGQYGRPVFVGASGTGLTMTPPSTSGYSQQIMGVVKDDDEIMLFPEPAYIEIA